MQPPPHALSRRTFLGAAGAAALGAGCAADYRRFAATASFARPELLGSAADVDRLLASLTLDEKIRLLSGEPWTLRNLTGMLFAYNTEPIVAGALPEKGVPGIRFTDGPRGVVMGRSTCFPVAMARGATWDPALERRVGDAIGVEARAQGANLFAGVCVNQLRHPAWGRAQESYGEDPLLLGELGAALVTGVQRHVMACVKHFALNSIEDARFSVDVRVGDRALREVYLPHFKRCLDAGAAAVMCAYNQVNGAYCSENRPLLTGILRDEWRWEGFVMSDFWLAVYDGPAALNAGLDLEMPFTKHFGRHIRRAVEANAVSEARVTEAARRMLVQEARFAGVGEPGRYAPEAVASAAHRELAYEAAVEGMVLLKNDAVRGAPVLPLAPAKLRRVALIGPLIDAPNIGDEGSSAVRPPQVTTIKAGLARALGPDVEFVTHAGYPASEVAKVAAGCDAAVAVVGFTHADEGENIVIKGGDRRHLTLRPRDERLLLALAAANPKTVAVLIGGSAIVTEAWRARVPAILMAWYPGMEGGRAVADVLLGAASPGGKLPCVFPRDERDLPHFDPHAGTIEYGLFHGYRLLDRAGLAPAFAFGHGLTYTTFALGSPALDSARLAADDTLTVRVDLTNTGARAGSEVVQVYVGKPLSRVERAPKELRGFAKVRLAPGERRTVALEIPVARLAYYDEAARAFVVEPGGYVAYVGTSANAADLRAIPFTVG
jgi:beta-glucosidase